MHMIIQVLCHPTNEFIWSWKYAYLVPQKFRCNDLLPNVVSMKDMEDVILQKLITHMEYSASKLNN